MSVEYQHYLIPEDNRYRPGPDRLAALVEGLFAGDWIDGSELPRRGLYRLTKETDGAIVFPFEEAVLRDLSGCECVLYGYPSGRRNALVTEIPADPEEATYQLQLYLAQDYVEMISESFKLDSDDDAAPYDRAAGRYYCASCKAPISYELDTEAVGMLPAVYMSRIHRHCPQCGVEIDPSGWPAMLENSWTGREQRVSGGIAWRFALVIDVGGALPDTKTGEVQIHPELKALSEQVLQMPLVERWHCP